MARNPKDACVSWFHHHVKLFNSQNLDLDIFVDAFVNDKLMNSPFNDHVLKFWEIRKDYNTLFLHFEDMKRDLNNVLKKVSNYLGKSYSPGDYDKLSSHLSFDNMKNNTSTNKADFIKEVNKFSQKNIDFNFMRKGKVGSYKEELTSEQIKKLDLYVQQIEKDGNDFRYKFE